MPNVISIRFDRFLSNGTFDVLSELGDMDAIIEYLGVPTINEGGERFPRHVVYGDLGMHFASQAQIDFIKIDICTIDRPVDHRKIYACERFNLGASAFYFEMPALELIELLKQNDQFDGLYSQNLDVSVKYIKSKGPVYFQCIAEDDTDIIFTDVPLCDTRLSAIYAFPHKKELWDEVTPADDAV